MKQSIFLYYFTLLALGIPLHIHAHTTYSSEESTTRTVTPVCLASHQEPFAPTSDAPQATRPSRTRRTKSMYQHITRYLNNKVVTLKLVKEVLKIKIIRSLEEAKEALGKNKAYTVAGISFILFICIAVWYYLYKKQ